MSDENTENYDKYAEELSDYLNKANTPPPVIQETPGCGKAMVYRDRFDIVEVDPKTLNIEGYSLDKFLNSLFTQKIEEWFPSDIVNDKTIKELYVKHYIFNNKIFLRLNNDQSFILSILFTLYH